ncbi:T9SS type A sorting domain-containing protein [Lentimicrobium sp. S6]|uniref:T9SS type A sorting domain-containing protein n=1 Tax=Lentimicrobium sp. S6 TaxID=2735872 RepID=UPI0015521A07|nr:T9SS type A sorting domain-containing protein [Lentimicrobium sp. S6]NPD46243.1 T9SS type A sorting domain-containing protein [Lentimicrobium sp. S6]
MRKFYALIIFLFIFSFGFSQSSGDYRWASTAANLWNSQSWEKHNGVGFVATTEVPGVSAATITSTVYLDDNGNNDIFLLREITIASSGKVIVEDGSSAFTVYVGFSGFGNGDFVVNGELELEGNNSNVNIGTASSSIVIETGGKLTDNSGGGKIVNSAGADGIVLKSSSGNITGSYITSGSIVGTFNQYVSDDQWHLISPIFGDVVSGDFWDGVNDSYLRPYLSPGDGWDDYIYATDTPLGVGEGYEYWATAPFTYSESGSFNTGNKTLTISTGGATTADFCLVGNPYPCGIDWGTVGTRTKCDGSAFYVYSGTTYLAHNGVAGAGGGAVGNATSGIIPAMQGFFVKSLGTGNVSLANSNKAHSDVNYYKSDKTLPEYVNNFIKVSATLEGQFFTTVLYQQADATNGADDIYDAGILFNNDPDFMDFYSFADDKASCINIYNDYPYNVSLGCNIPEGGGSFTIALEDIQNSDGSFIVELEDLESGEIINLLEEGYTVNFSSGGSYNDRFVLHLNSTVGFNEILESGINVYGYQDIIKISDQNASAKTINVYDLVGKLVYSTASSNEIISISLNEKTGYYIVEVVNADVTTVEKVYIQSK